MVWHFLLGVWARVARKTVKGQILVDEAEIEGWRSVALHLLHRSRNRRHRISQVGDEKVVFRFLFDKAFGHALVKRLFFEFIVPQVGHQISHRIVSQHKFSQRTREISGILGNRSLSSSFYSDFFRSKRDALSRTPE